MPGSIPKEQAMKQQYRLTEEEFEKLKDPLAGHITALWCQIAMRVDCWVMSIKRDEKDPMIFHATPTISAELTTIDRLETMLENRRWNVDGDDERMAFDALPGLLAVARAAQACRDRIGCSQRTSLTISKTGCGKCEPCVLLAALDDLGEKRGEAL
jgi:hypothetical protein